MGVTVEYLVKVAKVGIRECCGAESREKVTMTNILAPGRTNRAKQNNKPNRYQVFFS